MIREHTITIKQANMYGLVMFLPILVITALPFFLLNDVHFSGPSLSHTLSFILLMAGGIVVHELLHGVVWALGQRRGWKAVKFGFNKEWLTPYCHCDQPISVLVYRLGAMTPLVVLGIIPLVVSYGNGSFSLWLYGFIFTVAAGGDMIAIWMVRHLRWNSKVMDHPENMGFIQIESEK